MGNLAQLTRAGDKPAPSPYKSSPQQLVVFYLLTTWPIAVPGRAEQRNSAPQSPAAAAARSAPASSKQSKPQTHPSAAGSRRGFLLAALLSHPGTHLPRAPRPAPNLPPSSSSSSCRCSRGTAQQLGPAAPPEHGQMAESSERCHSGAKLWWAGLVR